MHGMRDLPKEAAHGQFWMEGSCSRHVFLLPTASCSDGLPKEFPAPDFALKDLFEGGDIRLSAFKGRPLLPYFFACW